jgi:hypothetical protein
MSLLFGLFLVEIYKKPMNMINDEEKEAVKIEWKKISYQNSLENLIFFFTPWNT